MRSIVLLLFAVGYLSGCQDEQESLNKPKKGSVNPEAQMNGDNDEDSGETDNEDSSDNQRRRQTYIPGIKSPINKMNVEEYIRNYLALLRTATADRPINLVQKYKVAGKIDGGKFLHAFPNDQNEHVMINLGLDVVQAELNKESTYTTDKAFKRWKKFNKSEKSAIGLLFLETLVHELGKMNSQTN